MCMSTSNAAAQAQQQQQQQQQAINSQIQQINSAFANRQSQYNNYLTALNQSYQTQLNLQQSQASRGLKFALARNGMTGSSVAADQGAELQRENAQGQITAEEQAQAKLAGLESSDVATKNQMISLAEAGGNIGNAAQQTATALQANIQNAQQNLGPNTLGQVFGGVSNTVNSLNTGAQQRLGFRAAYANPFTSATSGTGNTLG